MWGFSTLQQLDPFSDPVLNSKLCLGVLINFSVYFAFPIVFLESLVSDRIAGKSDVFKLGSAFCAFSYNLFSFVSLLDWNCKCAQGPLNEISFIDPSLPEL